MNAPAFVKPATNLHKAVETAKWLRLEIARMLKVEQNDGVLTPEDDQVIQDTFDGETTLEAELEAAVIAEDDDLILVEGIKSRISDLKTRLDRIQDRIETRRGLIEAALIVAGWDKHTTPVATLSLRPKPPAVVVDDESQIPTQFFKRADPALNKAGLLKTLKERRAAIEAANAIKDPTARATRLQQIDADLPPIDGCHLEDNQKSLTIRRK